MKLLLLVCLLASTFLALSQSGAVGEFSYTKDIGNPKNPGSSAYDPATNVYFVKGSGYNIWFNRDEFHFLHNKISGNFILTSDFEFVNDTGNAHRKMGWMVRESDHESSASMNAVQHGDGLVVLQWRRKHGENMRDPEDEIFFPAKKMFNTIQLERKGDLFTMRIAEKGKPLQDVGSQQLNLPSSVLAGIFVCSHDENLTDEVKISNVSIVQGK